MCPGISASLSEPAYAIFASWPKKRRSRILSEFIEDHRRCQNRAAELKRLREDVKALSEALADSGYFQTVEFLLADESEDENVV